MICEAAGGKRLLPAVRCDRRKCCGAVALKRYDGAETGLEMVCVTRTIPHKHQLDLWGNPAVQCLNNINGHVIMP